MRSRECNHCFCMTSLWNASIKIRRKGSPSLICTLLLFSLEYQLLSVTSLKYYLFFPGTNLQHNLLFYCNVLHHFFAIICQYLPLPNTCNGTATWKKKGKTKSVCRKCTYLEFLCEMLALVKITQGLGTDIQNPEAEWIKLMRVSINDVG